MNEAATAVLELLTKRGQQRGFLVVTEILQELETTRPGEGANRRAHDRVAFKAQVGIWPGNSRAMAP